MSLIYATRIPDGLAGAESCGSNQKWDPNYVFNGIKGQCVPSSQPLVQMASEPGFFTSFMSAFSTPKYATPIPTAPTAIAPAGGMSQNTMIAIGLGAVGLIAILMATRK